MTIPDGCSWTVVFDQTTKCDVPEGISHLRPKTGGFWGHPLRNVGLDYILSTKAMRGDYIYFLDDDNIIHPDWFEAVKDHQLPMITWGQLDKAGKPRLPPTKTPKIGNIDTASYMVRAEIIRGTRFDHSYEADGIFAMEMSRWGVTTLDAYLCFYNFLGVG